MKTIVEERSRERSREGSPAARRAGERRAGTGLSAILLACGLALVLLAAVPGIAAASTPEVRGEWELVIKSGPNTLRGTTVIGQEANASGEFASPSVAFEFGIKGTFSGKLEGSQASVLVTTEAAGPMGPGSFVGSEMTVASVPPMLTISGPGTLTFEGQPPSSATLTATRVKTYKQIEEQEERERREREEREVRERVRGEWELVLSSGPTTVKGVARISKSADSSNDFASASALFEGAVAGAFAGKLEGAKATVEVTTEAFGGSRFTSAEMTVSSTASSMSMSGSGTLKLGASEAPATLTATRVKTYGELLEAEAQEKLEAEAKEREAQERLAAEAREREARERLEREARERLEREAAAKQAATSSTPTSTTSSATTGAATVSAQPLGSMLTASSSGPLTLRLANPNAVAVHGRLTLLFVTPGSSKSGRPAGGKGKAASVVLGASSFAIAAGGRVTVSIKLTRAGRALLAHRHALAAVAKIVTQASGQTETSKTYRLTLHTRGSSHRQS